MPQRALKPSTWRICVALLLVVAATTWNAAPVRSADARPAPGLPLPLAAASLDAEKRQGERLVQTLHLDQVLGPLAPVALSPFFALTCLSGASLMADASWAPDWITKNLRNNPILGSRSALNNGLVFIGLLALTVVTAAPKLTKVTKPLGQAIDQLEAHAGIIAIVAVQLLSRWHLGESEPRSAELVYQAGIFSATAGTVQSVLLAAFSALNILVVNTVKFFFEVLIWLSPFPAVDAAFETANKAIAGSLVALYLFSPWLAMLVNLLIFAVCLLIFAWVRRRAVYMRSVLGDPVLGWIAERVFRRPPLTPTTTRLPARVAARLPDTDLVLKAFVGARVPGLKRKTRGFLVRSGGRLYFATARWLRAPVIEELPSTGQQTTVKTGLLSNSVVFASEGGEPPTTAIFTRRYNGLLDAIRTLLAARTEPGASAQAAAAVAGHVTDLSRPLGAAAQQATGRSELRGEFA